MILLVANNEAVIRELEARACAYVNENDLAKCSSWSAIYTDGKQYGFLWSPMLVPAFDDSELGTIYDGETCIHMNVIEADPENWVQVQPEPPVSNG